MHLDAYIRVSKVGGRAGESFISPDVQREQIERWTKGTSHSLTWHEPELDVSGGTMKRPIFDRILQRVEAGETDGVIVAKLDRFSRSLVGALGVLERFDKHGAVLVSVSESIDLSTPTGRAFMRMLLIFGELERERIIDNWQVAVRNAVDRGVHISKFVPRGYEKVDQRLVPNNDAPAIREAFLMRAAGRGNSEIARMLDERAPIADDGCWTTPMVSRLLKMRVYAGEAFRGDESNPAAHEAIVGAAEWQAAQIARSSIARGKQPNLLGGIVRCAGCRYVLAPGESRGKGKGPAWRSYRCRHRHTAGECLAPTSVSRARLDEYVEAAWREHMAGEGLVSLTDSTALDEASAALSEAEGELRAFASDLTARKLLGDGYHDAMATRSAAVQEARAAMERAMVPAGGSIEIGGYDDLPIEDRKRVLASSIDAVFVTRTKASVPVEDRVLIVWRGDGPDDLPRRGRRDNGPIRPYAPA